MRKVFFLSFSKRTNSDMVTCFPGKLVACRCCGRILSWRPLATCGTDFFGRVRFGCGLDICFVCLHSRQLARVGARMKDSWNMLKSSRPITSNDNMIVKGHVHHFYPFLGDWSLCIKSSKLLPRLPRPWQSATTTPRGWKPGSAGVRKEFPSYFNICQQLFNFMKFLRQLVPGAKVLRWWIAILYDFMPEKKLCFSPFRASWLQVCQVAEFPHAGWPTGRVMSSELDRLRCTCCTHKTQGTRPHWFVALLRCEVQQYLLEAMFPAVILHGRGMSWCCFGFLCGFTSRRLGRFDPMFSLPQGPGS